MIILHVTDREGVVHDIPAAPGNNLMHVVRDQDIGMVALCGGMCSCATCHVYVDPQWIDKLPPGPSYETELIADLPDQQPTSRLACQIVLSEAHDGLSMTLAPDG